MATDIHIACSADSRFAADCAVMLHSLLQVNDPQKVVVHYLYDRYLPPADLDRLRQVVQARGARWSPQLVPESALDAFPETERFGLNAWYRTLLPELLPALDRILYLDSDLLILGDLRPLWDTDLGASYLAAVTQPTEPEVLSRLQTTLGLPDAASYFNSGVMLLDLAALRSIALTARVSEFVKARRAPTPWADQDPLNAILHERRLRLHPRWNVVTPLFLLPARKMPFTPGEVREAVADPAVIHFIGPYKPWHYRCRHPYRDRYFDNLEKTPWKGKPVVGRSLRHMLLRPLPWDWQFPLDAHYERALGFFRRLLKRVGV